MKRLVVLGLGCLILNLGTFVEAQVPKKADIPRFVANLKDKDAKVRLEAAQGIGKVGQVKAINAKEGIEPLCDAVVKDDDAKVRAAAAGSLGQILLDPDKVVPVLAKVVKEDKDGGVQTAAITTLGYYGKDAKDALSALEEANTKAKQELEDAAEDKAKIKVAKGKLKVIAAAIKSIGGK
jgi:HEAT repeat protein